MRNRFRYAVISITLVIAIVLQLRWPAPALMSQPLGRQETSQNPSWPEARFARSTVYLPLVVRPPGPPTFEILSPREGWTISGMLYFAAQPTNPATVSSVSFSAGGTALGSDGTPEDGYKIFLDAGAFPAGPLQLAAVAIGPTGQMTKTLSVNVVPNPPSSGTVGSQGGVFASEIGSLITFPPGAVPAGTTITVTEKNQQQVTADTGIDWEALGVTFLGAQKVQSSVSISTPLMVASAGFGPRVQPGQAVVNYSIIPDANGDGIDELVVVNSASVAPNGDVISDPVPQLQLESAPTASGAGGSSARNLNDGVSGSPGTLFEIRAVGFNPFSAFGNVAVYRSSVDGTELRIPAAIVDGFGAGDIQTLRTMIPSLPPGAATMELRNESTGATFGPLDIAVETPTPLARPPEEIIDEFLVLASTNLDDLRDILGDEDAFSQAIGFIDSAKNEISILRPLIQEMSNDPEAEELLVDMAIVFENPDASTNNLERISRPVSSNGGLCENKDQYLEAVKPSITDALDMRGVAADALDYFAKTGLGAALGAGFGWWLISTLNTLAMVMTLGLVIVDCNLYGPLPPQSIYSSPLFFEGMGAAPPVGGSGVGNAPTPPANGGADSSRPQSSSFDQVPGRVIVKVASASGSAFPFSGATDAGGYFFIPLIPENEPFVATAIDTQTGQMRTFEGVGPLIGESVFMSFDFFSGDSGGVTELQFGEPISTTIASPTEIDAYSFQGAASDQVFLRTKPLGTAFPVCDVYRPDGTLLCPPFGHAGSYEQTCALDATGTYTLLCSDSGSDDTGPYQLYLQRLNSPAMASGINFGQTVTGTLAFVVALGAHTFDGAAGDQVLFRMSEVSATHPLQPEFWVFKPDGTPLCDDVSTSSHVAVEETCILDTSGTHAVLAGGWAAQSLSPYALYLQSLNNPSQGTPISFGEVTSGTLEMLATSDTYRFDGASGDQVILRMARTATLPSSPFAFWPSFRVLRQDGTEVCSAFGGTLAEATCTLDVTGTYAILATNRQGIGSYNLFVQRTNNPAGATPISYGGTITDSIDSAAEQDAYSFDGMTGNQVLFRMTGVSGSLDPQFGVYRPDGTLLCSALASFGVAEATCTLDTTGSYIVLVGDRTGTHAGTYRVFIDLN
jgi:hypothetical protein